MHSHTHVHAHRCACAHTHTTHTHTTHTHTHTSRLTLGRWNERDVQRDKVSNRPDLIKLHELHPKLRCLLCWDQRIIPHSLRGGEGRCAQLSLTRLLCLYLHAKGLQSGGHFSANPAQTNYTKSLSFQLHTHVLCRDEEEAYGHRTLNIRNTQMNDNKREGTKSHTFFLSHSPSLME